MLIASGVKAQITRHGRGGVLSLCGGCKERWRKDEQGGNGL